MFPLFRKRQLWLPTWQTCLIALTFLGLITWLILSRGHSFLSITERAEGAKVLVIEGWIPDHILVKFFNGYESGKPYDLICTTGAGLPLGHYLSDHKTFADLTGETIEKIGVPQSQIVIASSDAQPRDRTYHSAVGFRETRKASANPILRDAEAIDVLTDGAHGRRTRMVFQKVLGDRVEVGVISAAPDSYDPDSWFTSSEGVKAVIMESISVFYEWIGKKSR